MFGQDTLYLKTDSVLWGKLQLVNCSKAGPVITDKNKNLQECILAEDTYLWTARRLFCFKKDNQVVFNKDGYVISGVLAERSFAWTAFESIHLRADSYIYLSSNGSVLLGELSKNQEFIIGDKIVMFRRAEPMEFDESGKVKRGTIENREHLINSQGKEKLYKAGSVLIFNENSEVTENLSDD